MASSAITSYGQNYIVNRVVNGDGAPEQTKIAVGTGTTPATTTDTSMEAEEHVSTFSDANANLYNVAGENGTYRANIEISGGVEVPADTEVTEFGIKTSNDDLVYREVRSKTTVGSGERITFEIEIEFINQ